MPLAALLGLALSACTPQGSNSAPVAGAPGAPAIVVREDVSRRYIEFIGPKILFEKPFLGIEDTNYYALRSWLDRQTGAVTHQLYVSESYFGVPHTWTAARDGAGEPLQVVPVSSEKIACNPDCSYADDFAAELPDALLRKSRRGLAVIFTAQAGVRKRIDIPAAVVGVELATVDAWRRRQPVKTADSASSKPDRSPSSR